MTKVLHVGDVHAEPHTLDDCAALLCFVMETAKQTCPDLIVFEGDQHHSHSIVHVDVLAFWKSAFTGLKQAGFKVVALVGNHDMTGVDGNYSHAMLAYTGDVRVIDKPTAIDNILFMPYCADPQMFIDGCNKYPACPTVVCHQTFQGGTYENGFYAKDGLDSNLIPQERVISGHIHTPQAFGKVIYTGAPRWRTLSDANIERAIWLNTYKDGHLDEQTPYSTGEACKRVWHLIDTPEKPITQQIDGKSTWRIDIHGPPEYVQARRAELQAPGVRIRSFPTQTSNMMQVRESEGIQVAFEKFLGRYQAKYGTSKERLEAMIKERLG